MRNILFILSIGLLWLYSSCEKFLEEKSDKKLAVPHTLEDFQALMDDVVYVGGQTASESEISTDDYYLSSADLASVPESEQALYQWSAELPDDDWNGQGWQAGYREVYYCNLVLEGISGLSGKERNSSRVKDILGQSHIKRGAAMLAMAEVWTPGYSENDLIFPQGIPIRKNTNFNEKSERASVTETYAFIESDLLKARDLLPVTSISKYRPSKSAAYGYLARFSLFKNDYAKAAMYADSCIILHGEELLNFATLDASKRYAIPLPEDNPEVVYVRGLNSAYILDQSMAKISSSLLKKYQDYDYRLHLLFASNADGSIRFRGSYRGSASHFSGIAIDEMYLIKIEGLLQTGELESARAIIKEFIKNRYDPKYDGELIDLGHASKDQLLDFILVERRKELPMRGLRWSDVKRLNKIGWTISLERKESNISLPANDLRFALPIPQKVIDLTGMSKSER